MAFPFSDARDRLSIAVEALARYKLRTALSVLGVLLGVAATIAMMSVGEGARREALAQLEMLGLDNVIARRTVAGIEVSSSGGLQAGDADLAALVVPQARLASPLVARFASVRYGERSAMSPLLGVRSDFRDILRLVVDQGRFLAPTDERVTAPVCVLGATLGRELFGRRPPIGADLHVGLDACTVIGVLREQGQSTEAGGSLAWHDLNRALFVPIASLSGRTIAIAPGQAVDEIWLQAEDGASTDDVARGLERILGQHHASGEFTIVVPRELLAQRTRTQQTFRILVGSLAALALILGGIGVMNIMLASVVERTHEIGIRRTVGATRRHVAEQFLLEALLMTTSGGAAGILLGVVVSVGITAFAGWQTHVSVTAIVLGLAVSCGVGLAFGIYPAMKAAAKQPAEAVRYE